MIGFLGLIHFGMNHVNCCLPILHIFEGVIYSPIHSMFGAWIVFDDFEGPRTTKRAAEHPTNIGTFQLMDEGTSLD